MKKISKIAVTVAALAVGTLVAQAQWTYVDAIDFNNHSAAPAGLNTYLGPSTGSAPFITSLGDGDANWRFRNTGPAYVSYLTNSYQGRLSEGDPAVFTQIAGLTPGQVYTIKLYGVWSDGNNKWALSYSLDGGASWSGGLSRDEVIVGVGLGYGQGWVDDGATTAGVGLPVPSGGDSRGNLIIGTAFADAAGEIWVGVVNSPNAAGTLDRGVYDGVAWAEGVVPEPTTFALAGLGAAAMLIFRRRR